MRSVMLLAVAGLVAGAAPQCSQQSRDVEGLRSILTAAYNKRANSEFAAARVMIERALAEAPEIPDLLNTLASLEHDMGEYLAAEHTYLRALSISKDCADTRLRMTVLNNLATLYLDTGQYAKGERVGSEIEQLPPHVVYADPASAARVLNVLAFIQHVRNQDAEAERGYIRSIELWERAEGVPSANAEVVRGNLGILHLESGRLESAVHLFRDAMNGIQGSMGREHPLLIHALFNLANVRYRTGHPDEAEPLARRAVELGVRFLGVDHPDTAKAMLLDAQALRQLRRKREAKDLEARANATLRKNSKNNFTGYAIDRRTLSLDPKR